MNETDVFVIGGGPAGLAGSIAASIRLAADGLTLGWGMLTA